MPTSTPALARPSQPVKNRRFDVAAVAVGLGICIVVALSAPLADPARVEVVIYNPTAYAVNVAVSPADGGNLLGLGTVGAGAEKSFTQVIDQGERWSVHFSYGGVGTAPIEMSRSSMSSGELVVPSTVASELGQAGLAPTPP